MATFLFISMGRRTATRSLMLHFLLQLLIESKRAQAAGLCLCQAIKHDTDQGGRDQNFFLTRTWQDTRLGGKPDGPQAEGEQNVQGYVDLEYQASWVTVCLEDV